MRDPQPSTLSAAMCQIKMPRSLYLVLRRGAPLSHATQGLMHLLNA